MCVPVEPAELGCRHGLSEDDMAVLVEMGAQERLLERLIEVEAQRQVGVAELYEPRASPAATPGCERLAPRRGVGASRWQVLGRHSPAGG